MAMRSKRTHNVAFRHRGALYHVRALCMSQRLNIKQTESYLVIHCAIPNLYPRLLQDVGNYEGKHDPSNSCIPHRYVFHPFHRAFTEDYAIFRKNIPREYLQERQL